MVMAEDVYNMDETSLFLLWPTKQVTKHKQKNSWKQNLEGLSHSWSVVNTTNITIWNMWLFPNLYAQ